MLPRGVLETDLTCVADEFVPFRGGGGTYQTVRHPVYWDHDRDHIACGIGAILFLSRHSSQYRFNFTRFEPKRTPLSRVDLIPEMVASPKWTVNGKERWYFFEALNACARSYFGTVRCPTGAGKTEIAICLAVNQLREYGTGLILVPNPNIKDQFIERADDYGIELVDYTKVRKIDDIPPSIIITTPIIFYNDLRSGTSLHADDVAWIISDESHYSGNKTWSTILRECPNLQRSHGFSATPVDLDTVSETSFRHIPVRDALAVSTVGPVIYSRTAQEIREFLNIPVLINIAFHWANGVYTDQEGNDSDSYFEAVQAYENRINFITGVHKILLKWGYNTMHHVMRCEYGAIIRDRLNDPRVVTWYGNGYVCRSGTGELLDKPRLLESFGGEITDIIATYHAIAGLNMRSPVDCVLTTEGKSEKSTIQKVGRGTRPSRRRSIVVNLYDTNCKIAHSQARKRSDAVVGEFGNSAVDVKNLVEFDRVLARLNS